VDAKASLKGAWLSHVNHLNFGRHNHIPGMADRLRCCQLSLPCNKLLTVGGNVDHIHHRDLYSAARPSRRNGFVLRDTAMLARSLEVVILSVRPSVTRVLCD